MTAFSPRRISLRALMALVAVSAMGLGAMKTGSPVVAVVAWWLFIFALLTGAVAAIVRWPSPEWLGFSLFGWGFSFFLPAMPSGSTSLPLAMAPAEAMQRVADLLHRDPPDSGYVPKEEVIILDSGKRAWSGMSPVELTAQENRDYEEFESFRSRLHDVQLARQQAALTGLSVLHLAVACLGAVIGRLLAPIPGARTVPASSP